MPAPPAYFEGVRIEARRRWEQLERDPALAGPWWQLFRQVQNPRHVLSELLQNADDAGANAASVDIDGDIFIFRHDGRDFTEGDFRSLCQFGYSNKRTLHTIGFRGIGFKSAFSLGDRVELATPSLSLFFEKHRFTEPVWTNDLRPEGSETVLRVRFRDPHVREELARNMDEWLREPLSLLFFHNVRALRVGDREILWERLGPGPCPSSDRYRLRGEANRECLLVRSERQAFPPEALAEIREERGVDDNFDLPPCGVELVLGRDGRFFTVLPTEVATRLPFACNAPFLQDPARVQIKDPATSVTNRWLLERLGRLAAEAMLAWLQDGASSGEERARAYGLLPDPASETASLAGSCEEAIRAAFSQAITNRPIVLTEAGILVEAGQAIAAPQMLQRAWSEREIASLFGVKTPHVVSRHVSAADRRRLAEWKLVRRFGKNDLLDALKRYRLPKPSSWGDLLALWSEIDFGSGRYTWFPAPDDLAIVPVRGSERLHRARECLRLPQKGFGLPDEDAILIRRHIAVIDEEWIAYLEDLREKSRSPSGKPSTAELAWQFLNRVGLATASRPNRVISLLVSGFDAPGVAEAVRIAHIAARLDAEVPDDFPYYVRTGDRRCATDEVLIDPNGVLTRLLPAEMCNQVILHARYTENLPAELRQKWWEWSLSHKSKLRRFPHPRQESRRIEGREHLRSQLAKRGFRDNVFYPYVTASFIWNDYNYPSQLWGYWSESAEANPAVWAEIGALLCDEYVGLSDKCHVRIEQIATTGRHQPVHTSDRVPASWIVRLREKPCFRDTEGTPKKPDELYRRTRDTEPLQGVEPFLAYNIDNQELAPFLDLLGVLSEPSDPGRWLQRLEQLSSTGECRIEEAERLYRALAFAVGTVSTDEREVIIETFRAKPLVLGEDGEWRPSPGVFRENPDAIPGIALLHPRLAHLGLWDVLRVPHRPNVDTILAWLRTYERGRRLRPAEAQRIRRVLVRYPADVWNRLGSWLSLGQTWTSTEDFRFSFVERPGLAPEMLFPEFREITADLREVPEQFLREPPFCLLSRLDQHMRFRPTGDPRPAEERDLPEWLRTWANTLKRVILATEPETQRVREAACRLARARWCVVKELTLIPYVDGRPAGTPVLRKLAWCDEQIFVRDLNSADLSTALADELHRVFMQTELRDALLFAFERSNAKITAYMEEKFRLETPQEGPPTSGDARLEGEPGARPVCPGSEQPKEEASVDGAGGPPETRAAEADVGNTPSARIEATEVGDDDEERAPVPSRRGRPPLLDRFASRLGMTKKGEHLFVGPAGERLRQSEDHRALWELLSASGKCVQRYWVRDRRPERTPLEMPAEIWLRVEKSPDSISLVLADLQGEPREYRGRELLELRQQGRIEIYPAAYRLRFRTSGNDPVG